MAACCTYLRPAIISQLLNKNHTEKAYLLTKNIAEFSGKHTHTNKQTTTTKNGHSRQKKKIRRKEQWEQADKQERRY